MTLQTSGAISLDQVNTEFGLGSDINSYRNVSYYKDDYTVNTFPNTNFSMTNFYGTRKTDPLPVFTYLSSQSVGTLNADVTGSYTANIGAASETRRLIFYNLSDIYPATASYTCQLKVNGTLVPRNGLVAEGSAEITNAFSVYTARSNLWISDVIPAGTSVNWSLYSNCRSDHGNISIASVTNLFITDATQAIRNNNSTSVTYTNALPGTVFILLSRYGAQPASNSTNRTSYSQYYGSSYNSDAQNNTRSTVSSVTFTTATGPSIGTGLVSYRVR